MLFLLEVGAGCKVVNISTIFVSLESIILFDFICFLLAKLFSATLSIIYIQRVVT